MTRVAAQRSPVCAPEAPERLPEDGGRVRPLSAGAVCYAMSDDHHRGRAGTTPKPGTTPAPAHPGRPQRPLGQSSGGAGATDTRDPDPRRRVLAVSSSARPRPSVAGLWEVQGKRQGRPQWQGGAQRFPRRDSLPGDPRPRGPRGVWRKAKCGRERLMGLRPPDKGNENLHR